MREVVTGPEIMELLRRVVSDFARSALGHPVSLERLLLGRPDISVQLLPPPASIAASSVVRWDRIGVAPPSHWPRRRLGELSGWRDHGSGHYSSFTLYRPEYADIGQCTITHDWSCDISEVHGFAASKSELREFSSTDAMVERNSRDMIDTIAEAKLTENLAHDEIRIIHAPAGGGDYFERNAWDAGRVFLINGGGSHHFAAAKYIATRLQRRVPLRGRLNSYSLNSGAVASLCRDFDMFVVRDDDAGLALAFADAMRQFRATWLWHHMPRPYDGTRAVLLPRAERRSVRVAALLREGGVADLGEHLTRLSSMSFPAQQPLQA